MTTHEVRERLDQFSLRMLKPSMARLRDYFEHCPVVLYDHRDKPIFRGAIGDTIKWKKPSRYPC